MSTLHVLLHVADQRDYELHSLDLSTAFLQGSLHEEIWLRRPPGFTGSFPAGIHWSLRRPVYGLRQAPREWYDTLRTTLAALGFAPSTTDPSIILRTDTSLPPFYVLVYVNNLVFAIADTEALSLVKSKMQKRHTCTDQGELRSYLGLHITRDRARRTITLTQSHMVHQVLQRFSFLFSSPQPTPLSTGHSLSAPHLDECVEPSGPYPELVGCLMYMMTCCPHWSRRRFLGVDRAEGAARSYLCRRDAHDGEGAVRVALQRGRAGATCFGENARPLCKVGDRGNHLSGADQVLEDAIADAGIVPVGVAVRNLDVGASRSNGGAEKKERTASQFFHIGEQGEQGDASAKVGAELHPLEYWVFYTGTAWTMTPRKYLLDVVRAAPINEVCSTSGHALKVAGAGRAAFHRADGKPVVLHDALLVPDLKANLIYLRKLAKAGVSTSTDGARTYKGQLGNWVLWDLHESKDVYRSMWQLPALAWHGGGPSREGPTSQGECNAVGGVGGKVSATSGKTDWATAP
ncbi:unnamed protein product [Closterium sp. NIES-54]